MNILNRFLNFFGIQIKKTASMIARDDYFTRTLRGLEALYQLQYDAPYTTNTEVSGLIFSKNRAMQLDALLKSYFLHVSNAAPLAVLYTSSVEDYQSGYEKLKLEYKDYDVLFIQEKDFYSQVLNWVKTCEASRIFFMTDDAIIKESFDMQDVLLFDTRHYIFSLTKGNDLDYCFNAQRKQELPSFQHVAKPTGEDFMVWEWKEKPGSPDWNYPLSVDGNIFSREEMEVCIRHIQFKNPNSFEANLQVFSNIFQLRKGVGYTMSRYVNIPCNLVQDEIINTTTGTFSARELNQLWLNGKRIDTTAFNGLPAPIAQKAEYSFI